MKMKKYAMILVVFIFGAMSGFILMGVFSMKASKDYLEIIRVNYKVEQESLAAHSFAKDNLNDALIHYSNVVQAYHLYSLDPERERSWSFAFPFFYSFVLNKIFAADEVQRGRVVSEGYDRAKLGFILESLGRKEDARNEYLLAAKLTKINDIDRVKRLANEMLEQEKTRPIPFPAKRETLPQGR